MIPCSGAFREVEQTENGIRINGRDIAVFSANDSKDIPWDRCGAEYIVESTGAFNTTELSGHLAHGAKKRGAFGSGKGSRDADICNGR